jgi:glycerate 2-kinase
MLVKNYDTLVRNGSAPILQQKRRDVLEMLSAAVDAVQPYAVVRQVFQGNQLVFASETIDLSSFDHLYLIGFGKASVGMAQAVCDAVTITKGTILTNNPAVKISSGSVEVSVGGHPVPNKGSITGADKILDLLQHCSENDAVIVLISGGGSSLFCKPRVPLCDLQETITLLLRSGVSIDELNAIRKHLSLVKGGQLVKKTKATMFSLIISDVVNDSITSIASGPTAPDPTTFSDAKEILLQYDFWKKVSQTVRTTIEDGVAGRVPETLKENDSAFERVFNFIVANNEQACRGAVQKARELGYEAKLLTTSMTGEAKDLGPYLIQQAQKSLSLGTAAFITGGESTVTVQGGGIGGRNQELVLSCVEQIAGTEMVIASFATDGIDGTSTAAGALADGLTLSRALQHHFQVSRFLQENDSYTFFHALGDAIDTGLTGTNVMDIQIIL